MNFQKRIQIPGKPYKFFQFLVKQFKFLNKHKISCQTFIIFLKSLKLMKTLQISKNPTNLHSETHLHLSINPFNLCLLQSHPLDNSQRRSASITIQRQRFNSNVSISMDKVHLNSSLIILQGQQSLPHDWIPF